MTDEQRKQHEEAARRQFQRQVELQQKLQQAQQHAQQRQQLLDAYPQPKYAIIVAVDQFGGFSKDGQIPWNYPEDFKWFKSKTDGHICIMGRKTYEDINARLGEKAAGSVLPNRKCFVVSSTLTELPNATPIKGIRQAEFYLADYEFDKTRFIIGGEQLFVEGIALASEVYLTAINKDFECDKFFPVRYLQEHFTIDKIHKHDNAPDCRFITWKRNK